jgi:hypothetical protein
MVRPWKKKSAWPYVAKSGRKSYTLGFYDHEKVERSRSFPSVRHARGWMDDYITAERRGRDSLRRFLLDLDAKEANEAEARSIGDVLELYLAVNAHPRNEGGLGPSTYERYEWTIGRHLLGKPRRRAQGGTLPSPTYALAVASVPAVSFNKPQAPRAWREDMLRDGVHKPTREQAWSVLSAALSWAAASQMVPEIQTNGYGLANEQRVNRRRSMRHGGTGYKPAGRRRGGDVASWALSPQAVEAIREQLLLRVKRRREILAHRDAMVVSLQYGLGARNQEVWGLRWASLAGEFAWVLEVLSSGQLSDWGKTEHSTQRRTAMPSILREDLSEWRDALRHSGHPAREFDFIIPGDLSGAQHGVRDPHTGACHFTDSQARSWGRRLLHPGRREGRAAPGVRPDPRRNTLRAAPRRHIPAPTRRGPTDRRGRVRDQPEDAQRPLRLRHRRPAARNGPRSAEVEWRAARAAQANRRSQEQAQRAATDHDGARRQRKFFAWFSARKRGSRVS